MEFEWSSDTGQADWWTRVLHPFAQDVGSVSPDMFPAYARVFHPVEDETGRHTWADVAAENSRTAHTQMQFHEISRPLGSPRPKTYEMDQRVQWGSLPKLELEALSTVLTPHTKTPDRCWAAVWEGFAQLHGGTAVGGLTSSGAARRFSGIAPETVRQGPRVAVPQRNYFLLSGTIAGLPDLFDFLWHQSPNAWWSDDRAWFVATEIDFAWTYVGGSTTAIDSVLAHPELEALPAKPTDQFSYDSDVINAKLEPQ